MNGSPDHARVLDKLGISGAFMIRDGGNWLLRFEGLQDVFARRGAEAGLEEARKVLSALNSLREVGVTWPHPLESSFVFHVDDHGKRQAFGFFAVEVKMSVQASVSIQREGVDVEKLDHIDLTTPLVPFAVATEPRRRALRLLAGQPSYRELNVVLEDALAELGGRKGIEAAGIDWTEVERFKQSANSVELAGDSSRHGASKRVPPPARPMDVGDARAFVLRIVGHWIAQPPPT